jgi:hypothetical protein
VSDPAFASPQVCVLCGRGPYAYPSSLRDHVTSGHPWLSDRERGEIVSLAQLGANGRGPRDRLSLRFRRPQLCPLPGCGWGPCRLQLSLWLHAYLIHGYLSLDELSRLMESAMDRAELER